MKEAMRIFLSKIPFLMGESLTSKALYSFTPEEKSGIKLFNDGIGVLALDIELFTKKVPFGETRFS